MRVAIVEDDPTCRSQMEEYIRQYGQEHPVSVTCPGKPLVVLVQVIQWIGNRVFRKLK